MIFRIEPIIVTIRKRRQRQAIGSGEFGHAAVGGDAGGKGDTSTNSYKTLGELEGGVNVTLSRVGHEEKVGLLLSHI